MDRPIGLSRSKIVQRLSADSALCDSDKSELLYPAVLPNISAPSICVRIAGKRSRCLAPATTGDGTSRVIERLRLIRHREVRTGPKTESRTDSFTIGILKTDDLRNADDLKFRDLRYAST